MHASTDSSSSHLVIDAVRSFVEGNQIAGAIVLVAQNGRILEFTTTGYADIESKRLMTKDDMFWVASMTKPVVSAAIMMLSDEGKLSVDDPVEKHLKEFKGQWLITEKTEDRVVLQKNTTPPTLRHLLAHTDGLTDIPDPYPETPLAEWVISIARQPLQFPPGSKWAYNNAGMNTLGRIIEVVSGQTLPDFLRERFFDPLGMKDTTFILSDAQMKRLATSYRYSSEEKKLNPVAIFQFRSPVTSPRLTICPGGGLFSTTMDMFTFYQMLLDGGTRDGRRYLSEAAFKELTTCQTGDLETGFTPGMCFGLGVGMVKNPTGPTARKSVGTFGHGGVYGTQAWVDPGQRSATILMCQVASLTPNPAGCDLTTAFNNAAADLLDQQPAKAKSSP